MVALVVNEAAAQICSALQQAGKEYMLRKPSELLSLTGFLMENTDITHMVVWDSGYSYWSDGHVLAAAKLLQNRGGMILMGAGEQIDRLRNNELISIAGDGQSLLRMLNEKHTWKHQSTPARSRRPKLSDAVPRILPMNIPDAVIVIIDVIGSQPRIGCTTQAVALWHYCKALGFNPAVVTSRDKINEIAAPMHGNKIDGGYEVEGVQFVEDTYRSFDCYIRDNGSLPEKLPQDANVLFLVAGVKPWELEYTMRAVRAVKYREMCVLLSFATRHDCEQLAVLFGKNTVVEVPWIPDPWHPSWEALSVFEKLLRPALEHICREELVNVY